MKTEIMIHGHGGAQEVFDRHTPLWKRHNLPVTVFCSNNDPLRTAWPLVKYGQSGPSGPEAAARWEFFLLWMLRQSSYQFVIFEYDAFCLSKEIRFGNGLYGNMTDNLEGKGWIAHRYPGHPYGVDRKSVEKMLKVLEDYPDVQERGFIDRQYSALAHLACVPMFDWKPFGYCRGTIEPSDIPELKDAISLRGARMIHGVKTKEMLDVCLDAMKSTDEPIEF